MEAVSEASGPLLAGSTLASKERVARMISMFLEASFSFKGSWLTVGGFIAPGAASWLVFLFFSVTPGCSASSVGLSEEVEMLTVLSLPAAATSEAVSVLEPEGIDYRMAKGLYTISTLLSTDESSTPAWLRASFHT